MKTKERGYPDLDEILRATEAWDIVDPRDVADFVNGRGEWAPPEIPLSVVVPAVVEVPPALSPALAIGDIAELSSKVDELTKLVERSVKSVEPKADPIMGQVLAKLADLAARPEPAPPPTPVINMPPITINMPSSRVVKTSEIQHDADGNPTKVTTTEETIAPEEDE